MLTARTTEEDKVAGLETGADDYLTKPFSPRELVARVHVLLRRAGTERGERRQHQVGDLLIDEVGHTVRTDGRSVQLTPREFAILAALACEPGWVFTRQQLIDRALGYDYDGLERTLDVHVGNLRRKLEPEPARRRYVVTVHGIGYKLSDSHAEGARETLPRR